MHPHHASLYGSFVIQWCAAHRYYESEFQQDHLAEESQKDALPAFQPGH